MKQTRRFLPLTGLLAVYLLGLTSCGSAPADPSDYAAFPPITEVAEWFKKNVNRFPEARAQFEVHKKPTGYFVAHLRYENDAKPVEIDPPLQVWSLDSATYLKISAAQIEKFGVPEKQSGYRDPLALAVTGKHSYDENLFYGYKGWQDDVVDALEGKDLPTAKLWYALGRAAGSKSMDIIDPRHRGGELHPYEKTLDPGVFSDGDLDEMVRYAEQAQDAYRKAIELDPDMPIMIGTPRVKLGHEAMAAWLELTIIGQDGRAAPFLEGDIYPAASISFAKNLLNSCEENALLFSNGDGDTYPLLYVQAKENFRTDVTVLNLSLLNLARYIHFNKALLPPGRRAPISMETDDYRGDTNSVKRVEGRYYQFDLPDPTGKVAALPGDELLKDIVLKVRPGDLLYKQDQVVLDIIATNAWERPIYFTNGVPPSSLLGMNVLQREAGLTRQVVPYSTQLLKNEVSSLMGSMVGAVRTEPLYTNLTEEFTYEGIGGPEPDLGAVSVAFYSQLQNAWDVLLAQLAQAGDTARFRKAIAQYLEVLPPESKGPKSLFTASVGHFAEDMGEMAAAERLTQMAKNHIADIRRALDQQKSVPEKDVRTATFYAMSFSNRAESRGDAAEEARWRDLYLSLSAASER